MALETSWYPLDLPAAQLDVATYKIKYKTMLYI